MFETFSDYCAWGIKKMKDFEAQTGLRVGAYNMDTRRNSLIDSEGNVKGWLDLGVWKEPKYEMEVEA